MHAVEYRLWCNIARKGESFNGARQTIQCSNKELAIGRLGECFSGDESRISADRGGACGASRCGLPGAAERTEDASIVTIPATSHADTLVIFSPVRVENPL